jgi:hypothetical protein
MRRTKFMLALLLSVVGGCLFAFGFPLKQSASIWLLPKSGNAVAVSPAVQTSSQTPRQFFRVWVHRNEIMPDLIYARPGLALLRAENQTSGNIELMIERVTPNQANITQANIRTLNNEKRADREIILQPGEYVYFTPALPELKGRLVVTAAP